ncbi:hypothetical protein M9Y10_018262 [Tritrichomonas musculus]|uniref:Uncharacterized protein n=1 Tax=Tritrichomonas musculus TaxID=1915356 RepID=A0ABR2HN67_9EUKA
MALWDQITKHCGGHGRSGGAEQVQMVIHQIILATLEPLKAKEAKITVVGMNVDQIAESIQMTGKMEVVVIVLEQVEVGRVTESKISTTTNVLSDEKTIEKFANLIGFEKDKEIILRDKIVEIKDIS